MITFLPYASFQESAKVLDRQRLGKQRLEAKQILEINLCKKAGFLTICLKCGKCSPYNSVPCNCHRTFHEQRYPDEVKILYENHPAVRMWRTHEDSLAYYGFIITKEWLNRGYDDNVHLKFFGDYCHNYLHTFQPNINFWPGGIEEGVKDLDESFAMNNYQLFCSNPWWLGEEKFHDSHMANLYMKKPSHYYRYFGEYLLEKYPQGDFLEMPYEWCREYWKEFEHE